MTESALYRGVVWHRRLQPKVHEFQYSVCMVYLDLDELETVFSQSRCWQQPDVGARSLAPVQLRRGDFFRPGQDSLQSAIRDWLAQETGRRPLGPIRMLANLRTWGYLINPITCYYVFDDSGQTLQYVIAEVTNTPWEQRHQYLLTADDTGMLKDYRFDKQLFVSPFYDMNMHYRWSSNLPSENLSVLIDNYRDDQPIFNASMNLRRYALNAQSQRAFLWRYPWMTAKVAAAIYWQALRLLGKRIPLQTKHRARVVR